MDARHEPRRKTTAADAAAAQPRPAELRDVLTLDAGASGMILRHLLDPTDRRALRAVSRELSRQWTRIDELPF